MGDALVLTLPSSVTGVHEKFKLDPILPDNGGAVFLVDPTNPLNPWPNGMPAHNADIPNLVAMQPELGVEDLHDALGGPLTLKYLTDGLLTGSYGKMERTSKGGLHTIISQDDGLSGLTGNSGGTHYQVIRAPGSYEPQGTLVAATPLSNYFYGTDGTDGAYRHSFYLSMWLRVTRRRISQLVPVAGLTMNANYTSGYNVWVMGPSVDGPDYQVMPMPGAANYLDHYVSLNNGLGNTLQQVASTDRLQLGGGVATSTTIVSALDAGQAAFMGSSSQGNAGSFIFYRSYMEDLTVSGRTFEEVASIDQSLYEKEMLTPGGRYYGDTFTDPATIP